MKVPWLLAFTAAFIQQYDGILAEIRMPEGDFPNIIISKEIYSIKE